MKTTAVKIATLLAAALLLTACAPVAPVETTTAPTTAPTTKPTTAPTTAPTTVPTTAPTTTPTTAPTTAPTEPEPTVLDPELWLTDPQYPTYEELLSMAPAFADVNTGSWLVMDGDSGIEYSLTDFGDLAVLSSAHDLVYPVPNAEALQDYYPMATDGKHVYMQSNTEILKVELLTGETVGSIQTGRVLVKDIVNSFVMYYIEYDGTYINVCRAYLPEMKRDVLDSFDAPSRVLLRNSSVQPDGSLAWILLNPEMVDLLEKELQNPESPYKTPMIYGEKADFSYYWTTGNFWDEHYLLYSMFLFGAQEMSGIRAFVEYTYHFDSGNVTTRTGVIDNCSFGTGQPHDHFKPEITEIAGPTVVNGSWKSIPNQNIQGTMTEKPTGTFSIEQRRFGTDPVKLYRNENGYLTELAEISFKKREDREDAIYGITQDNRLVQLSYDGTVCNTLYTGTGTLWDIIYLENGFYLVDDNQLIEIDMTAGQYRVLVKQDYMWDIDFWDEKEGTVYILASEGLTHQQHKYDPATGTLEKVSVMW